MPMYEYQCNGCHHRFERIQLTSAKADETTCPQCQASSVQRLMSTFASQIKGDHKPGFAEMKAYNMYNERMDKFAKLPPITGARATPPPPNMSQASDSGAGQS